MSIGPKKSTRRERMRAPTSKLVSAPSWMKSMLAVLGEASDELEVSAGLVERAQAGVEPEREALGRGPLKVVERDAGVAVVARARRGVVEVVVRVGDQALGERGGEDAAGGPARRRGRGDRGRPGHGVGRPWARAAEPGDSGGNPGGSRQGQGGESGAPHRPPHSKRRRSGTTITSPSRIVIMDWMAPPRSTALKLKR